MSQRIRLFIQIIVVILFTFGTSEWCYVRYFKSSIPFQYCSVPALMPYEVGRTNTCIKAVSDFVEANENLYSARYMYVEGNSIHVETYSNKFSCSGGFSYLNYPLDTCIHISGNTDYIMISCSENFPFSPDVTPNSFIEMNPYEPLENCTENHNSILSKTYRLNTCTTMRYKHNVTHDKFDYVSSYYSEAHDQISINYFYDVNCTDHMRSLLFDNLTFDSCLPYYNGGEIKLRYFTDLPNYLLPFTSEKYLVAGLYYTPQCHLEMDVFVGKSVIPLMKCSNIARKYANDDHLLIYYYQINDEECLGEFTYIVRFKHNMSSCDVYVKDKDSIVQNIIFYDPPGGFTYYISAYMTNDLNHLKPYVTINKYVCGNHSEDETKSLRLRYSEFSTFLHHDICIENLNAVTPGFEGSMRGDCAINGQLRVQNYDGFECKGFYHEMKNDFCVIVDEYSHMEVKCAQLWCDGYSEFSDLVCSSHGTCIDFDICECDDHYEGDFCENDIPENNVGINSEWIWIALAIFVVLIILVSLLLLIIIVVVVVLIFSLRKIKDYKGIEDIDILLSESRASKRGEKSYANLKIDKKKFVVEYSDLKVVKKIGEGGSNSVVYLSRYHNSDVAFKCFRTTDICSSQSSFDEFEKEVSILANIKHPHILGFVGATVLPPRVGIVCEYCSNGDLKAFLEKKKRYAIGDRIRLLAEISSAMQYLHSLDIIHRDLKCENVLLTKGVEAKVMDFGLSKVVDKISKNSGKTSRVGTAYYMAPEMVHGGNYDEKVDIFSFSILSWEVIHGDFNPYGKNSGYNVEVKVAKDPSLRPRFVDKRFSGNDWLKELIQKCWEHEANTRPSFKEIVETIEKNHNVGLKKRIPDSSESVGFEWEQKVKSLEEQVKKYKEKFGDM